MNTPSFVLVYAPVQKWVLPWHALTASGPVTSSVSAGSHAPPTTQPRRGKALPTDTFSGDGNANFEDWIPALERRALWNAWLEEETLSN